MKNYFYNSKLRDVVLDFFGIVLWVFIFLTKDWTIATFAINIIASILFNLI